MNSFKRFNILTLALAMPLLLLSACGGGSGKSVTLSSGDIVKKPSRSGPFKVGSKYRIMGRTYRPKESYTYNETGIASWYGPKFHGKKTANGERYDQYALTAAHKTLQMPAIVRVTNMANGKSLIVRVNDRGPYSKGRIIDMSKRGAQLLGFIGQGTTRVRVQVMEHESRLVAAAAKRGKDVSGVEIALNEGRSVEEFLSDGRIHKIASAKKANHPIKTLSPQVTRSASLGAVANNVRKGIFVQAGSFGSQDNAIKHAQSLADYGSSSIQEVVVNDKSFYRVHIGPLENLEKADILRNNLASNTGRDAFIVVGE